jgi:hypothetical protein
MKKYIAALISLLLIISLLSAPVRAETPDEVNPPEGQEEVIDDEQEEFTEEELAGVLTPDSPWYFIKSFIEFIRMTLTFDAEKKTELIGELAAERAKELQALELKLADGEITEEQLALLEKTLDALIDLTEKYVQRLGEEVPDEGDGTEPPQEDESDFGEDQGTEHPEGDETDSDEDQGAEPPEGDETDPDEDQGAEPPEGDETDPDEDQGNEPPEDDEADSGEDQGDEPPQADDEDAGEDEEAEEDDSKYPDKYLKRIAHLKEVAKKAPKCAHKGLARAIANAHRQRARMIATGKLKADLPYSLFKLEIVSNSRILAVELEQKEGGIEATVEKGAPDRTKKLQHACALAYLLPILEPLELKASLSQEQIITMLLKAFSWDQEYSQLEILVELNDGSKIEIIAGEPDTPVDEPETPGDETENPGDETENPGEEDPEEENPDEETEPEEQEEEPGTLPDLAYKKFEVKLKAHHYHQHIKYDLKPKHLKAEVKVTEKGKEKVKLKDAAAVEYFESIFGALKINSAMPRQQVAEELLRALNWDKAYDELEAKIVFADGTKIDFKDKGLFLTADLAFTKFETKIKSGGDKFVVKFERKRDKVVCMVESKGDGKPKKIEKAPALDYLLPILRTLDLNASMPQEEVNGKLLAAFAWDGDYDELEIKITFTDKSKLDYKSKDKAKPGSLPFAKFELEIEARGKELSVDAEGNKAEVKIEQKGKKEVKHKGKKAVDYLLPILEKLDINASMSQEEITEKVLAAFAWEGEYEEFELYVKFLDGSKVIFKAEHDD